MLRSLEFKITFVREDFSTSQRARSIVVRDIRSALQVEVMTEGNGKGICEGIIATNHDPRPRQQARMF